MLINFENIVIRSAVIDDAYKLNEWWNDGRVMDHAGFPNGLGQSLEKTREQIIECDGISKGLCIIEIDGASVGELSYTRADHERMEVGWKICNPSYQNKGYGPKIINTLLDFAFSDPNINSETRIKEIVWDTDLNNQRAHYVYLNKIKAERIKVNKNSWTDQLGNLRSSVDYLITRDQFYSSNRK